MEILLFWLGRIGDFVVASPVFEALKRRYPGARLTLVSWPGACPLAELDPHLREVWKIHPWSAFWRNLPLLRMLITRRFHLAADLNPSYSRSSALLTALCRARQKISFKKKFSSLLCSESVGFDAEKDHMMQRYAALCRRLGAEFEFRQRVYLRRRHEAAAESVLSAGALAPDGIRVAVHPGNFKKYDNRWPERKFVELTRRLLEIPKVQVFYLAGPGEEAQVLAMLQELPPAVRFLPPMPLAVTAALLKKMRLFIGHPTSTMHLACAVGTPTLTLISRYNYHCWRPLEPGHHWAVSEQWDSCRDIPVDAAW
ncbi:MAG: glycosyltransferase family 9 protein, partial [Elusimicrobia bacterium]|nr:glycosyltransferase family 9 protein [Elusimicrobiota bacterium]